VSRTTVLAHISREADGVSIGAWGPFTLKTAFQPIFVLRGGKLFAAGFEGLVRPLRGTTPVSPAGFFASIAAEHRFSIETLTRTLHLYNAAACLPKDAAIFVNFDPSVFIDAVLVEAALSDMSGTLCELGIDPRRIVCEVTEQKTASREMLRDFTSALRHSGFSIAVDDFGSANSDIARIRALNPEIVKFDAAWTARMMQSGPGLHLLTVMVEGFARQGITSVFEGIEENWRLEMAERVGAAMVQGYALARPQVVPASFAGLPRMQLAEVTERLSSGGQGVQACVGTCKAMP